MADGEFEEFERMMSDSDFIDVANPHVEEAVQYAHEQRRRMLADGKPDYRATSRQPEFPFPEQDNPMLAYLVTQARTIHEEGEGFEDAVTWLAVHAWYEGALNALEADHDSEAVAGDLASSPELITTHYTGLDEAVEMVKAADTLSLGVRAHNRWVVEQEDEHSSQMTGEWVVELLETAPEVREDDE